MLDLSKYAPAADEVMAPPVPLPTGSLMLDSLTGIGGLPLGRIIEVFGKQSSGKSTLLYQAIGQVQRMGGAGVLLDFENAFTDSYGTSMGIDTDPAKWLLRVPRSLESGFEIALNITKDAVAANTPLVIGFDSLEAMPMESETELNKRTGDIVVSENNMAGAWRAKAVANFLRQAGPVIGRGPVLWVLINHEKPVIHTGFVTPLEKASAGKVRTPGGTGPKFYSSVRLQFTPTGARIKGDVVDPVTGEITEGVVGTRVVVEAVKNKVGPPNRRATLDILFGQGIDNVSSVFEVGLARGLITKDGGHNYTVSIPRSNGEEPIRFTHRGKDAFLAELRKVPQLVQYLSDVLRPQVEASYAGIPVTNESEQEG